MRALLTREGSKARDFLDVYFVCTRLGIKLDDVEKCIVTKTDFALKLYDKYRTNLKEKIELLNSGKIFEWGEERNLLLSEINEREFYTFLDRFQGFLAKVVKSVGYA